MEEGKIRMFKKMLEDQLNELAQSGEMTLNGLKNEEHNYADPLDRASVNENQGFMLHIKNRESRLINKIRNALERIEEGDFGLCEVCGEEISYKRLLARPVATQCITCKTKLEKRERIFGT
ncbi:MAG: RNA polymerase-binding protein DksA [Deltaproteobacteria bacterium]|nr:MAG: RNA polymerase-binding protein DksA [Deltaproteobacteria bacterium]